MSESPNGGETSSINRDFGILITEWQQWWIYLQLYYVCKAMSIWTSRLASEPVSSSELVLLGMPIAQSWLWWNWSVKQNFLLTHKLHKWPISNS